MDTPAQRLTYPRSRRLAHNREYQAAYKAGIRQVRGPLIVFGRPNALAHPRLGLSVSRRVGNAVVRNRVKRMLREAFRLNQSGLPTGLDLVVNVRPHSPLPLARYAEMLLASAAGLEREWARRARREQTQADGPVAPPTPGGAAP